MPDNQNTNASAYTALGTARTEKVQLPEATFDGTINMPVMHQAVKAYLANQRLGLAYTKTRGLVTGGNQKSHCAISPAKYVVRPAGSGGR